MAASGLGNSPLDIALNSLGATPRKPDQAVSVKDSFDGLARETNVPANVLLALDEAEGGAGDLSKARRNAAFLSQHLAGGAKIEDAVSALAGDPARGASLMDRSYDIADALYAPETPEAKPEVAPEAKPGIGTDIADLAKAFAAGAVNVTGGAVQALGAATDDALRQGARSEIEASGGDPASVHGESVIRSGSRTAADAVRGVGDDISAGMSDRMQQAMEGTQFDGELFSPSTWTAGKNPSVRGVLGHVAQGLGSMAPVAAAAAVSGPAGAAALGGLGAAGEGAQEGRDFAEAASGREGEFGPAYIESMPGYQALRDEGLSHDDAADELARRAESEAGARQAVFGAIGGAATGKILSRAGGLLNSGGRAARIAKKGAASAIEEGAQEAAEGMAAKSGIEAATGADVNINEGSFGNFALGAMSGGAMGAAAGAMGRGDDASANVQAEDGPAAQIAQADPLMLPAPESGGTIFGQSQSRQDPASFERDPSNPRPGAYADQSGAGAQFRPGPRADVQPAIPARQQMPALGAWPDLPVIDGEFSEISPAQNTSLDGSEAGAVAAPGVFLPAPTGAATTNTPLGPVAQAAQSIVAATPAPAPEIAPTFPEYKPGAAIKLGNRSTGEILDGVFMGETPEGNAKVRVQGAVMDLTPQEFDALRDTAPMIEAAKKEATKAPAAGPLAQRAQDVIRPQAEQDAEPEGDEGRMALLTKRMNMIHQQASSTGWNRRLTAARDKTAAEMEQIEARMAPADSEPTPLSAKPTPPLSIEPIREKAAILRGWDKPEPPTIDGVSIKHDSRAGGWVFSRKHEGKVKEALGIGAIPSAENSTVSDEPAVGEIITPAGKNHIDAAAAEAPPEPTEAQKEAGNYNKGAARWNGLDLSIENAKGSERRGTGRDGKEWSVTMPAHYGYFKGTEASDGDHVDFYMGDNPDAANAYVIDQVDAETGAYDEAKVMLGYDSAAAARAAHEAGFSDGKGAARMGGIKKMPISDLKSWLTSDATKKPVSMRARRAAAKPAPAPQKRPLIHYVTTHLGGINPTGKVAEELRHRGVNARTAPGLWRRAGHKDLDNIPAQDHPDIEALVGRADDRLYLNPERIIEAIVEEVAGRPQPLGEQAVLQQQAQKAEADRDMNLITTIRETRDGKFHYDLSKDRAGGEGRSETALRHGDAKLRSSALEGALADLNLDFVDAEINPVPTSALRGLAETVTAVMRQHGLEGRISPKVVRVLLTASGVPVHGSYQAGEIKVSADSRDATRTARHEIIHALRDAALWGRPYGLFTAEEWRALVGAAKKDAAIKARIEAAYPDLNSVGQTEEMVAELYADWAQGRREVPVGPLSQAFSRIRSFFRAVASALRGGGFLDPARIMERIADGEIGGRGPDGPGGTHEGDGEAKEQRRPLDLESALIGGDLGSISNHPDYAAAKAGDIAAAVRVALDIVSDDMVQRVRQMIGNNRPVIVPVVSEEASGRNKIPRAASEVLAQRLGLNASTGIVQSNTPKRTALSGLDRIFSSPEFDGPVMEGQDYLILDDTLTQGGTFAALSGHIEAGGGRVIGAVALTGEQYSAKLRPSDATLSALREKHGDLENDFRAATGYGFDSLTESEARYLTNFKPADAIRDRILAEGRRRSRRQDQGDDPAVKHQRDMEAIKAQISRSKGRALGMIGSFDWRKTPAMFSNLLTDAMGRNDRMNILSLVPGNALFEELAKGLPAAAKYLGEKRAMDAWRNDWQARAATLVDGWTKIARKNPAANDALMDLMHSTTLSGVDPTRPDSWRRPVDGEASRVLKDPMASAVRADWARTVLRAADDRRQKWDAAKTALDALPAEFREMYEKARDGYAAMADEQESALMQNIRAAARIALKRARREHKRELERIKDEGLTGEERNEAIGKANEKLTRAEARAARGDVAHLKKLRQMFETNRLEGPYFPLARFGNYFVTIRDDKGKVVSFSRFETASKQQDWIKTATERGLGKISHGTLNNLAEVRAQVDPAFVGEIEALLDEAGADDGLMDAVWQQWLQTLPDQSVRTARIHRKGRMGFNKDAIRAYSSAMFHGAHQTARLRHGMEMADALEDADEQAKTATDPNRAGFVVREMRQRHEFTMNPTNNPIVAGVSGAAFVWYLGMSPAAALVNLSQTTIVGVPLLAARFRGAGVQGAIKELGRASRDFAQGRDKSNRWGTWSLENSPRLSDEEKAAVKAGYNRGVIDKTQSHDLASVAESGLEHSPAREKVMRVISWGFHHTERMNREVTYLAAYRMARAEGMGQAQAIDEASRQAWKTHFDYQNTSRPRIMQGDLGKVLTTFRNFTVNMLYRLFRDTHQAFAGADAATRREARHQLVGITLSMFAHAGIRGVWGYGLLTMLLGLAFGADDDDVDEFLQDALLIEGDGPGVAAWNWTMGMALNGVPGQVTGLSLTGRIGMPDLWFRSPLQEVEGKDLWAHYTEQLLGPGFGIGGNVLAGLSMVQDGKYMRGLEKMVPIFAGNALKSGRYISEGVTTYSGDPIIESVNPYQALVQAAGFTPAKVAERYDINSRLKRHEKDVLEDRKGIMREIGDAVRAGNPIPAKTVEKMRAFNAKWPEYPITADGIKQSLGARQRATQRNEFGVVLNPKLNDRLRGERAPALYN